MAPEYSVEYTTRTTLSRDETPKPGNFAPRFMAGNMNEASLIVQGFLDKRNSGYIVVCDAYVKETGKEEKRQILKNGQWLIDQEGNLKSLEVKLEDKK